MQLDTRRTRLALVCLLFGLGSSGCGSSPASNTLGPDAFGQKYRFADNEIPNWSQSSASSPFWTGQGTDLHLKIDGGEPAYTSRGCLVAMYQDLVGPDPNMQACTVVAMDFGTSDQANAMFTYEQQLTQASVPIPSYNASIAIGESVLGGVTAYAHFKASYFEVQLIGYADQASASSVAAVFLQKLQSKTN
ncbi:MAG TPA: hypothetical protein VJ860_16390 [Polyangia bacterium]|nr:hypothetical protein [Polyangia bacterium]